MSQLLIGCTRLDYYHVTTLIWYIVCYESACTCIPHVYAYMYDVEVSWDQMFYVCTLSLVVMVIIGYSENKDVSMEMVDS